MKRKMLTAILAACVCIGGVAMAAPEVNLGRYEVPRLFYMQNWGRIQEQFDLNRGRCEKFVTNIVDKASRDGIVTDSYIARLDYRTEYQSESLLSVRRDFYIDVKNGHPFYGYRGYTYDTRVPAVIVYSDVFPFDLADRHEIIRQISEAAKNWKYPLNKNWEQVIMNPSYLPNYYISKEGDPVLIFNPYEIAPYEMGAIEITITGYRIK